MVFVEVNLYVFADYNSKATKEAPLPRYNPMLVLNNPSMFHPTQFPSVWGCLTPPTPSHPMLVWVVC